MKAIVTKFHGSTDTRGARISATAEGKGNKVIISYPYELDTTRAHYSAALKLCKLRGWSAELIEGGLPNGDYVWVFANSEIHKEESV